MSTKTTGRRFLREMTSFSGIDCIVFTGETRFIITGPVPDWPPVAAASQEEPEPVAMDLEESDERQLEPRWPAGWT